MVSLATAKISIALVHADIAVIALVHLDTSPEAAPAGGRCDIARPPDTVGLLLDTLVDTMLDVNPSVQYDRVEAVVWRIVVVVLSGAKMGYARAAQ